MKNAYLLTCLMTIISTKLSTAQYSLIYEIGTDTSWLTTDTHFVDWYLTSYNDSNWEHVVVPGVNVCGNVCSMWIANGADVAYFRKSFILPSPCDSAILTLTVDDDYVLYINDSVAHVDNDNVANDHDTLYISEFMHSGPNLMAFVVVDEGGCELICPKGQFFTLGKPTSVNNDFEKNNVELIAQSNETYWLRSDLLIHNACITLYDLSGQLLTRELQSEFYSKTISLEGFPSGLYLFSFKTNEGITNFKLLKN